jgi:hypothetical protein
VLSLSLLPSLLAMSLPVLVLDDNGNAGSGGAAIMTFGFRT